MVLPTLFPLKITVKGYNSLVNANMSLHHCPKVPFYGGLPTVPRSPFYVGGVQVFSKKGAKRKKL